MKIGDIDKNLKVETSLSETNIHWMLPTESPLRIFGLHAYTEEFGFIRMPVEVGEGTNDGVKWLYRNTAGGRIRFKTDSKYIAVKVYVSGNAIMPHITAIGQSGFDLYITEDHKSRFVQSYRPAFKKEEIGYSYEAIVYTSGEMKDYTLNMPLYSDVRKLFIGLSPDASAEACDEYAVTNPVLYYGSSITQGGCASRPGNSYQSIISRRFDCDYINLGFSGSARGEQIIAEYMASLHPSVFVLDYDHNAPSPEHLEKTHEPLFKIFRAANPDTPVVMVSKPDFRNDEDSIRRRNAVRTTYENALAAGDRNVYYIDGETLFEGPFRDSCTVDGCHPNDLGFFRMAQVIGDTLAPIIDALK